MITAILALLATIGWIIWATSQWKWHPFLVLLIGVVFLAIAVGVPLPEVPKLLEKGIGKTLQGIGLLIVFGSIIGVALEVSKATHSLAHKLLSVLQRLPLPFAVSFIGYLVAIPVFCDSAFVILSSLNERLANSTKTSHIALTVALSTGLFAPHVLIPPTPGPLAAAANLSLDNLFLLIVMGGSLAFVLVLIGGAYAYFLSKRLKHVPPIKVTDEVSCETPPFSRAIAPILAPILLMALGTIWPFIASVDKTIAVLFTFLSSPTTALGLGMVMGLLLVEKTERTTVITRGIEIAAPILVITALGGTLGQALQHLPLTEWLGEAAVNNQWGLLIPFLVAAIIKTAQGSSTVAIITTTAILFPLLEPMGFANEIGKVWVILAVGVGAMTVSHANDSYFWIVSQMGRLDIKTAYRRHTFATFLQGSLGIVLLLLARFIEQTFFR